LKGKILIVDDEASARELFSDVFGKEGYEVIAAEDGNRALDILKQDNIDVIFLDLKLFGMNGIDLCRQIRVTNQCRSFSQSPAGPLFLKLRSVVRRVLTTTSKNLSIWTSCLPL